jgi:ABC-type transport system substrate-binding protein
MDAAAVAWNFNRFMYLMNHTEELPTDGRAVKVHSLYEFPDGRPVFESVVALDVDTVVFTLTAPYAPIVDAMCYISCGIMSPDSTPATSIIDLATGDIVGTGPYTYDYYITDAEVRFTKFEDYWGADVVEDEVMFDAMIYSVIDDPSALNYAMLAGDVDFVFGAMTDLLPAFRANPWIHVEEINVPGLVYQYLAFNTHQINLTWRMAMSYALNYTYIIEELLDGRAFRAYGCISPGYGPAFNHWLRDSDRSSLKTNGSAVHDLETARNIILTGLGGDARIVGLTATDNSSDTAWEVLGQSPVNCLAYYNYSYNTDNWFRTDLYAVLVDWYADIGIFLEDGGTDWGYFILRAYGYVPGGYDQLQIYFIGWGPDYLDPFNMIDPLYYNISVSNACQINDPQIMEWLSEALETTDEAARRQIYHDIQWRLFAELYVHAPAYHGFITAVHAADLYDVEYDVMGRWWALPVKRNLTWVPDIG